MGNERTTEKKTITLRSSVIQKLIHQAEEENRNFSNMLETAAIEYLKRNDNNTVAM